MIGVELRVDDETLYLPITSIDNLYVNDEKNFEKFLSLLNTKSKNIPVYIKCNIRNGFKNSSTLNIVKGLNYDFIDLTESDINVYLNNSLLVHRRDYYFIDDKTIFFTIGNKEDDIITIEIITKIKYIRPLKKFKNLDEKMLINKFFLHLNNYISILKR